MDVIIPCARMQSMPLRKIREMYVRYERRISAAALLAGFIFDNITFPRINLSSSYLILMIYLAVSGAGIFLINLTEGKVIRAQFFERIRPVLLFVIQFCFGALFSSFVVFYSRGSALASSWPFLLMLMLLMVGNELLRSRYARLSFHMSIYFIALFSFFLFYVPTLMHRIDTISFLISGVASLATIGLFLFALSMIIPARIRESRSILSVLIAGLFIIITTLYFLNIIPPLPLFLKSGGIYHNVERNAKGEYVLLEETKGAWYRRLFGGKRVHLEASQSLYAFTSVFAPPYLETDIVHLWQYYDEKEESWITASKIQFPIKGGRDLGYRGYSIKSRPAPGRWRVSIETATGKIIARLKFRIERVAEPPALESVVR